MPDAANVPSWHYATEYAGRDKPRKPTLWAITDGVFTVSKALVLGVPVYLVFADRLLDAGPFESTQAAQAWCDEHRSQYADQAEPAEARA